MQRPTSVTVFGILNIVFGAMGVICMPFSFLMLLIPQPPGAPPNPVIDLMTRTPFLRTWTIGVGVLGTIAAIVLIVAGIGLLTMQAWGRLTSIGCAVYQIVSGIVGMVVNYIFLIGPLMEQVRQSGGPEAAGAIGGALGGTIGGCIGLIYPLLLLIFMTRPSVVQAFQPTYKP
ncbi:MAG: hypothetical protein NZT92_18470 [Abditibacteriales bacterium]|nr:hypothetical protein [Abditibacteriales bacterium]MDW8367804.1 hypothetical protein [Abditibacteriales bacterium]